MVESQKIQTEQNSAVSFRWRISLSKTSVRPEMHGSLGGGGGGQHYSRALGVKCILEAWSKH